MIDYMEYVCMKCPYCDSHQVNLVSKQGENFYFCLNCFRLIKKAELQDKKESEKKMSVMDRKTIKAAESILSKGDRVELIPVKDGVKVVRVRREEVKK